MRTAIALALTALLPACKEVPGGTGQGDAGGTGVSGQWVGTQSSKAGGSGVAAELELKDDGTRLFGVLYVSDEPVADAGSMFPAGFVVGPRSGVDGFSRVIRFLPDGGLDKAFPMTATVTGNRLELIEQNITLDGGPLPIHYRFDRK